MAIVLVMEKKRTLWKTAGYKKLAIRKKQELWFTSSYNDQIRYRMLSLKELSHEMDLAFDDMYG
jgi:hypothetical protein